MSGLKSFIFFNNLSQLEVAQYLGISKSYMSKLVSGSMKLRPEQFTKLMENDKGWNTEFLTDQTWDELEKMQAAEKSDDITALKREIESLREQLAKCEARCDEYWDMIKALTRSRP